MKVTLNKQEIADLQWCIDRAEESIGGGDPEEWPEQRALVKRSRVVVSMLAISDTVQP